MNIAQFNNAIALAGTPQFHIHIYLRGGTFVQGQFLAVINLPGGTDLVRVRSSELQPPIQTTLVAVEAIDAIEIFIP